MYNKTEQLYKNTPEKSLLWEGMMSSQDLKRSKGHALNAMQVTCAVRLCSEVKGESWTENRSKTKQKEGRVMQNDVEKDKKKKVNKRKRYESVERKRT